MNVPVGDVSLCVLSRVRRVVGGGRLEIQLGTDKESRFDPMIVSHCTA